MYTCIDKLMQIVLERGSLDKLLTFNISLLYPFQIRSKSIFVFWGCWSRHSDFPGYERDVIRISPDTRPSNSCSELAAIWASRLAALQPANTTASQQIRHTRAHVLISLECLHTTPILNFCFEVRKAKM